MRRLLRAIGAAALSLGIAVPVVLAANTLSDPSISPPSGTTETDFTFSVRYDSDQGRVPNWVRVTIGAVDVFDLALATGTPTHGTYAITLQLPAGTRAVTFSAGVSQGPNPATISAGSVIVTQAAQTPTPTPAATPTPTASPTPMPTATTGPTATPAPTATPRATPTRTMTASASPRPSAPATTAVPSPTTSEGVLSGTPPPSAAPSLSDAATPGPVAGLVSPRPAAASSAPKPAAGEDPPRPMPAGMIWMLVGGTISMSGAGMLAVLAVRHQRARQ